MGHDDFSTNEDFAAAVAQAQGDIEGVTSMQGTRVEPLERETDVNVEKSTFDKEMGAWKEVREKLKALSDEEAKSIAEFEALLARIRGEDTQATEEEAAAINATLSKQQVDAWANLLSQEQGLLNQTVSSREPPWGFKSWRVGQTSDEEKAAILAKASEDTVATKAEVKAFKKQQKEYMDNLAQETKRASVSPSMARTRMPDPIAPLGPYSTRKAFPSPLESSRIGPTQQQLDKWYPSPLESSRPFVETPTYSWPTIPTVQDTQATVMDKEFTPGAGMTAKESIERTRVLNEAYTLNPPHYPGTRPLDIDVPKEKPTKKDTKKTNYGAWKGLLNDLTPKQNLENKKTHDKAWMDDFEKNLGSAKYFGFTRPYKPDGTQLSYKENSDRNRMMRTDKFGKVYDSVYGVNPALKFGANLIGSGVGTIGGAAQKFVNKKGLGNADTFDQTLKKMQDGEFEGGAEVPAPDPRDKVTGGFWGLMAFAKKHPKIFGPLSGDELWALVSDPDGFWEFYEAALSGA